jgi:hypothetical protein
MVAGDNRGGEQVFRRDVVLFDRLGTGEGELALV